MSDRRWSGIILIACVIAVMWRYITIPGTGVTVTYIIQNVTALPHLGAVALHVFILGLTLISGVWLLFSR